MRQLKERITHNFGLEPLVRDDIANYLDFRMRAAGYRGPSVFSLPALKLITQSSLGLTRRINIIADKSLLAAFSNGSHLIGAKEAQAAIKDCDFSDATYRGRASNRVRLLWLSAAILAAILLVLFVTGVAQHDSPTAAPQTAPATGDKPLAPPPAANPAPLPPQSAVDPSTSSTSVPPTGSPSPPSGSPVAQGAPSMATPASSVAVSPAPTSAAPMAIASSDATATLPASAGAPKPDALPYPKKAGRLTRERIESSRGLAGAITQ